MKCVIFATLMAVPLVGATAWAEAPAGVRHLNAIASPAAAATPATLSEPTIGALQEALNTQGIAVKVDGVLSDETRAAIRKYQSQHHLPVTGEPDKATLDKLGARASGAPSQQSTVAQPVSPPSASSSVLAQAPTPPAPGAPMQPGQTPQGGMMMNCPMMQGQMTAMMQMMQGQMQGVPMQPGQMQTGQQPGQMQPGSR